MTDLKRLERMVRHAKPECPLGGRARARALGGILTVAALLIAGALALFASPLLALFVVLSMNDL